MKHYENFPVASLLLPRHLREPVAAIYAFARSADDIADEGEATPEERLQQLARYRSELDAIANGQATRSPLFARLAQAIANYNLPIAPFHHLLAAFEQDVLTHRYADYAALTDYCQHSAVPVGYLMMRLYRQESPLRQQQADAICRALQLINFCQDVANDWQRGRVYLPQEEIARFNVSEAQIASGCVNEAWRSLMRFQCARARALLLAGAPLGRNLKGRIGLELRVVMQGGLRILEKLAQVDYDVFRHRPQLRWFDWPLLLWRALIR